MVAIAKALDGLNAFPTDNRDDELIMKIASSLSKQFRGDITNPNVNESCLNQWNEE